MKKKKFAVLLLVSVLVLGSGYAYRYNQQSTEINVQTATNQNEEDVYVSPLNIFKEMLPEAEIYDSIAYDLDGNGEDDCIILYTLEEQSITSGLAVCLSNSNYSSIDLSGGKGGTFQSKPNLSFENELPVISLEIKNPKTGEIIIYSIKYSYDKVEKEANFIVSSELKTG